jgi:hypothetical protein
LTADYAKQKGSVARDQIDSTFPTSVQPDDQTERKESTMSSIRKRAKRKKETDDVKDLRPKKDAKSGAQKKEVPASHTGVLSH